MTAAPVLMGREMDPMIDSPASPPATRPCDRGERELAPAQAAPGGALPAELAYLAPAILSDLIRVGHWGDGGYVVPYGAVSDADALVSLGVNDDWSFETQFSQINPRALIHAYDHTVGEGLFRRRFYRALGRACLGRIARAELGQRLWLWREFRAFFGQRARHFEERIVGTERAPGDAALERVLARIDPSRRRIFLKVDIEGAEYEIVPDILRHAGRITALAVEFHDTRRERATFCTAMAALQQQFEIVHLHGNNCAPMAPDGLPEVLEVTLVRGTGSARPRRLTLPIGLDRPNRPGRADYAIRFGG